MSFCLTLLNVQLFVHFFFTGVIIAKGLALSLLRKFFESVTNYHVH